MNDTNRSTTPSSKEEPLTVDFNRLTVPINGFVIPIVVLLTLISNALVCVVLSRPSMRSQPSNILLLATAVTNTLTGLLATPFYIHFFALGNYADWLPYKLCFAYSCFTDIIPTLFHTSSVWLTVALALQRYVVVVCKSQTLKRHCTTRNAWLTVFLILFVAGISQTGRFLESIYSPIKVTSQISPAVEFDGCTEKYAPFSLVGGGLYFYVYYWFRILFIHLIPCSLLIVLNAVLVRTMDKASRRRNVLLGRNERKRLSDNFSISASNTTSAESRKSLAEYRKLTESNRATLMMVCVVGVCLVVELPLAILFFIVIVQNHLESSILDEESEKMASTLINLTILSSYQLNFFIYCTMSRQFRTIFKDFFCIHSTTQ